MVCLCPASLAHTALSSAGGPHKLSGEQMCPGSRPPKLPKLLPVLQDIMTAAIQNIFQDIERLTVLQRFSVLCQGAQVSCCSTDKTRF